MEILKRTWSLHIFCFVLHQLRQIIHLFLLKTNTTSNPDGFSKQLLTDSLAFLLKVIFLSTCCCRICGSYEAMGLGRISEALQDFTGGVIEMINLKTPPRDIYKVLQKAHDRHSLMGASIEV